MNRKYNVASYVLMTGAVLVAGLSGCAKKGTEVVQDTAGTATPAAVAEGAEGQELFMVSRLAGAWLGAAHLDEERLATKLASLAPEQREEAEMLARSFLSTNMAILFETNGQVQSEVEIQAADGQLLRESAQGAWKVVESNDLGFVVETQENLSNGSISTNRKVYQFRSANQMLTPAPVCDALKDCRPMLVFDRKILQAKVDQQVETR